MSEDLHADVVQALNFLMWLLSSDARDTAFNSIGCYDPALEDKWQVEIPGGPHLLRYETPPFAIPGNDGRDLLYAFMAVMKQRGIKDGIFYVHLKCLYLYTLKGITSVEGQTQEMNDLNLLVLQYNDELEVTWQVQYEEGGSAPIS